VAAVAEPFIAGVAGSALSTGVAVVATVAVAAVAGAAVATVVAAVVAADVADATINVTTAVGAGGSIRILFGRPVPGNKGTAVAGCIVVATTGALLLSGQFCFGSAVVDTVVVACFVVS
jgi:hypothetical protein